MRSAFLAVAAMLALATPAAATPSFTVSQSAAGPLDRLPATVVSRLNVTGSEVAERFSVQTPTPVRVTGAARVVTTSVVGPGTAACGTRWERFHSARNRQGTFTPTLDIPARGQATLEAVDSLVRPPWPGEDELGVPFEIAVPGLQPFVIGAEGPSYQGPLGVQLRVATTGGRIVVTTTPVVNSGRIVLRAFRRNSPRSIWLGTLPVRNGIVSMVWRPRVAGSYEVYALFRSSSSSFGDDATECGTTLVARR
jgi:hypothetical protein